MEPLSDKLARRQKLAGWIALGFVFAAVWFIAGVCVFLSLDDFEQHPFLEVLSSFMDFPVSLLPGLENYDIIGFILNCLLWGFFLAWLFRVGLRTIRRIVGN